MQEAEFQQAWTTTFESSIRQVQDPNGKSGCLFFQGQGIDLPRPAASWWVNGQILLGIHCHMFNSAGCCVDAGQCAPATRCRVIMFSRTCGESRGLRLGAWESVGKAARKSVGKTAGELLGVCWQSGARESVGKVARELALPQVCWEAVQP